MPTPERGSITILIGGPIAPTDLPGLYRRVCTLLEGYDAALAVCHVDGITADVDHCRKLAESSPSIVTPLNKYIGYEEAAKVAKQSLAERKTIRQVVVERGYVEQGKLTEQQLDEALDVLSMTHP